MPVLMPHPLAYGSAGTAVHPLFRLGDRPAGRSAHRPQPRGAFGKVVEQGGRLRLGHLGDHVSGGTRIPRGRAGNYKSGGARSEQNWPSPVTRKLLLERVTADVEDRVPEPAVKLRVSVASLSADDMPREVQAWIESEMHRLDPEAYASAPQNETAQA